MQRRNDCPLEVSGRMGVACLKTTCYSPLRQHHQLPCFSAPKADAKTAQKASQKQRPRARPNITGPHNNRAVLARGPDPSSHTPDLAKMLAHHVTEPRLCRYDNPQGSYRK